MFPFENSSVSIFSPYCRKWASGEMAAAAVTAEKVAAAEVAMGAAAKKTAASEVASSSRVTIWLVASFPVLSLILLLLCFSVPDFSC